MVSQACRRGVRKFTNTLINTEQNTCIQQACLLINRHSECDVSSCDDNESDDIFGCYRRRDIAAVDAEAQPDRTTARYHVEATRYDIQATRYDVERARICEAGDPETGRAVAPAADREVRSGQRDAEQSTVAVAGV